MAPKVRITKEEIVEGAIELVRQGGELALNARNLATALNCSTQPIFSNFTSMEELRMVVITQIDQLCNQYIKREVESGVYPAYKASGMAYIRFAKEEGELFKLLYMRDRSQEAESKEMELGDEMESILQDSTGLSGAEAEFFHLEMWAFVHGIATMFATGFLNLDWAVVSKMLTDVYQGLKQQLGMECEENGCH